MKKKLLVKTLTLGIIVLFIGAGVVSAFNANINENKPLGIEEEKIFNELKIKLEKVSTEKEAIIFFKETITELNKLELFPNGLSEKSAQRLITFYFFMSKLIQKSQTKNNDDLGNTNCLVIGFTNQTYFRPYPSLVMDIPFIYNLTFNSSFSDITCFLVLPYVLRTIQPFKLGPYAYFGGRIKFIENENITDYIYPSSGLILTYGSNGFKKWNGTFYGNLYTKYEKFQYNNYTSFEIWSPVGIKGFIGINFLSLLSLNQDIPTFYIGFAREVNFTYNPTWT